MKGQPKLSIKRLESVSVKLRYERTCSKRVDLLEVRRRESHSLSDSPTRIGVRFRLAPFMEFDCLFHQ